MYRVGRALGSIVPGAWRGGGGREKKSSLRSKRFPASSSRAKKRNDGGGGGERRNLFSPPNPASTFFFCSHSNFRAMTRLETLATQAKNRGTVPISLRLAFTEGLEDNAGPGCRVPGRRGLS